MKNLLIGILLVASTSATAQVNVEDKRMNRAETGLSGSINLSIELERGNSELTQIDLKPRAVYRSGPSVWFMLNSYSFVETDQGSLINEGFSHLRYNYDLTNVVVLELLTQVQYNREQDLRRRFLLGAGLRFELVKGKKTSLAIGVTGMYEREKLENNAIIETPRNSDYIAVRFKVTDQVTVQNTVYVQPAMDDISDIRVLDNLELGFALSKWLAFTTTLEYRYDSQPPEGIREYDLSILNGLTVRF